MDLFKRFLLVVYKHLFDRDTFAADPLVIKLSFIKAFHRNKLKKFKFLNMDFKTNWRFSACLILNLSFLSFAKIFFIFYYIFNLNPPHGEKKSKIRYSCESSTFSYTIRFFTWLNLDSANPDSGKSFLNGNP